jgi:hypothetical protein
VFGRYGFWGKGREEVWRVGDRVNVAKVNDGLTIWSKFRDGRLSDMSMWKLTVHRLAGCWIERSSLVGVWCFGKKQQQLYISFTENFV